MYLLSPSKPVPSVMQRARVSPLLTPVRQHSRRSPMSRYRGSSDHARRRNPDLFDSFSLNRLLLR